MSKVLIVGGGAAGMFASIFAAKNGNEVHVFEKNEKLGKKLFITGKGRCNVTNACDVDELFQNMVSNEKFMYSSFYGFTNQDVMDFFENAGLRLKTERGNRVFPQSDHAVIYGTALTGRRLTAHIEPQKRFSEEAGNKAQKDAHCRHHPKAGPGDFSDFFGLSGTDILPYKRQGSMVKGGHCRIDKTIDTAGSHASRNHRLGIEAVYARLNDHVG